MSMNRLRMIENVDELIVLGNQQENELVGPYPLEKLGTFGLKRKFEHYNNRWTSSEIKMVLVVRDTGHNRSNQTHLHQKGCTTRQHVLGRLVKSMTGIGLELRLSTENALYGIGRRAALHLLVNMLYHVGRMVAWQSLVNMLYHVGLMVAWQRLENMLYRIGLMGAGLSLVNTLYHVGLMMAWQCLENEPYRIGLMVAPQRLEKVLYRIGLMVAQQRVVNMPYSIGRRVGRVIMKELYDGELRRR